MSKHRVRSKEMTYVSHPRYGARPHNSGTQIPEPEPRSSLSYYLHRSEIFPENVLIANPEKQNYSIFPRKYYVDAKRLCTTCNRPFIFFAKEQQYWYESLRFYVDADCIRCPSCRYEAQLIRRSQKRYTELSAHKTLSNEDLDQLIFNALFLFARGLLKNTYTLGALKNRAQKQIPQHQNTLALCQALTAARKLRNKT